jgi:hypothetical protein
MEEFHNLYASSNVTMVIKSRRTYGKDEKFIKNFGRKT